MRPLIVCVLLLGLGVWGIRGQVAGTGEQAPEACACPSTCPQIQALTSQLETANSTLETLQSQLRLWGDRGRVDLVEAIIYDQNPSVSFLPRRNIAKAFVEASDQFQIPLLAGVAIANVESNFSNQVVGRSGEASLMQIAPLRGRPSCTRFRSDPQFAILWALENCFSHAYHQALAAGKPTEEALKAAFKNYNGGRESYANKVYQRYLWMKEFEAKGLYGWG